MKIEEQNTLGLLLTRG